MNTLRSLSLCLSAAVCAPASAETFTCQADAPGAPTVTMLVLNGELRMRLPDESKLNNFGPIVSTSPNLTSHLEQPLMTNGTGKARVTWSLNRSTGRYQLDMYAYNPSKPKPLEIRSSGSCQGYDNPLANNDPASSSSANKSSSNKNIASNDNLDEKYEREKRDMYEQQERDQAQRDREEQDRLDTLTAQRRADTERAERERVEAERVRKAEQDRIAKEQQEAERVHAAERARVEKERAEAEAKRRATAEREAAESGLRNSFSGHATTCAGGGKDVLYLQTNRPSKTGCNVRFEARCPGTPSGSGVTFGQANYVGGSCMGLGDNIRIGQMSCEANQVQVSMISASCQ